MGNVLGPHDSAENYRIMASEHQPEDSVTDARMASWEGNLIRVRLVDVQLNKLGVTLHDRDTPPKVQVKDLQEGGMLEKCGLVHRGDFVIQVNGFDTCEMTSSDVERLLSRLGAKTTLTLIVRGPDGYRSYLRTIFLADGTPKTVRVSEPRVTSIWGENENQKTSIVINGGSGNTASSLHRRSTEKTLPTEASHKDALPRKSSCPGADENGGLTTTSAALGLTDKLRSRSPSPKPEGGSLTRRLSKSSGVDKAGNMTVNGEAGSMLARRRSSQRGMQAGGHAPKKAVKLKNLLNDTSNSDTLHMKAPEGTLPCQATTCGGSFMWPFKIGPEPLRPKEEVIRQAKEFFEEYFTSFKRANTPSHEKRWAEVMEQIESTGSYWLTLSELTYGAKTAWRNAPRCIGRIQWSKLQVFDARHIKTARGMFEAMCNHLKYATNKGNLRSAITLFPPRTDGQHDFRIWNGQLLSYAGYRQPDGSVIGDPINADFTELCIKLGWKGPGGQFDILPWLLQANGADPELYDVPNDLVLEVLLEHQEYPWFKELGLKWYAVPGVSSMMLDLGGLQYTAAPFNGWYMGTEIGARDLLDKNRYNLLQPIAERMGLNTMRTSSLWKDQVLLEVNKAVLHSFQRDRVTISDHHSTAESFMKHMETEVRLRGGCPADWVWVNPPMGSSITPVFHQEMLRYHLRPSYEYQVEPWLTHQWKKSKDKSKKSSTTTTRRKIGFKELARAVKFSAKLMGKALANRIKCTILYATETGKSETFAKRLCDIFQHAFNAKVLCMNEYDPLELEHEALVLIVTSTFGNGDPPDNGLEFAKGLLEMLHQDKGDTEFVAGSRAKLGVGLPESDSDADAASPEAKTVPDRGTMLRVESLGSSRVVRRRSSNFDIPKDSIDHGVGTLANVSYSVFGLGSRAYPNFSAFAKLLNRLFSDLGAEVIFPPADGDELCGQEQAFQVWADGAFRAACDTFCVGDDVNFAAASEAIKKKDSSWAPGKFRLTPLEGQKEPDLITALGKLHNKNIFPTAFKNRTDLQAKESERQTILVELDTTEHSDQMRYVPGDHVAVYPANHEEIVDSILNRLHNAPDPDSLVKLEVLKEKPVFLGPGRQWYADERLPNLTLRTAFSRYLDVTTPPTPDLLHQFAGLADEADAKRLDELSSDSGLYENWKFSAFPSVATVLSEFPSLRVSPTFLLSQLPLLQPRFYSISSSPAMHPGEIHATVAVVCFTTQGGGEVVHHGVCSSWLNGIKPDTIVPCFVRSAPSFHLPITETLPVIMVGPGTGIAPFRAFWQQRRVDRDMRVQVSGDGGATWGPMTLYSGCRQAKIDNIYADEKSQALADGTLTDVHTALSREPNIPKTYVQNLLEQHSSTIFHQMMLMRGHFYICGDVSMAAEVCATLEKIIMKEGKKSQAEAKQYILKLRETNRFHEDIFGVTLRTSEVHDKKRDEARKHFTKSTLSQPSEDRATRN